MLTDIPNDPETSAGRFSRWSSVAVCILPEWQTFPKSNESFAGTTGHGDSRNSRTRFSFGTEWTGDLHDAFSQQQFILLLRLLGWIRFEIIIFLSFFV